LASTQDGQLRLHGRLLTQTYAAGQHNQLHHQTFFGDHALYLIVPKKRYRFAVDRNRVKRVVKAQLACILGKQAQQYQWVFRMPANKAKGVCLNPHTQAFAAAIEALIQQAQYKIGASVPPVLESIVQAVQTVQTRQIVQTT
jgi:RNase P protein component